MKRKVKEEQEEGAKSQRIVDTHRSRLAGARRARTKPALTASHKKGTPPGAYRSHSTRADVQGPGLNSVPRWNALAVGFSLRRNGPGIGRGEFWLGNDSRTCCYAGERVFHRATSCRRDSCCPLTNRSSTTTARSDRFVQQLVASRIGSWCEDSRVHWVTARDEDQERVALQQVLQVLQQEVDVGDAGVPGRRG